MIESRARTLRRNMTEAEALLWRRLRNRQLGGFKFRRQHPVGGYVVDFVCMERGLVVELDGGQHAWRHREDKRRTHELNKEGLRVLRFWNTDVMQNSEGVLATILKVLATASDPEKGGETWRTTS